jgi:hypothetical protein
MDAQNAEFNSMTRAAILAITLISIAAPLR